MTNMFSYLLVKIKSKLAKPPESKKGNGILIYSSENYTYIQYYNSAERDISQFGVTIDKEGKWVKESITLKMVK